jgi:hypothetical protein
MLKGSMVLSTAPLLGPVPKAMDVVSETPPFRRGLSSNGTENLHKELADGLSNKPRFDGKL